MKLASPRIALTPWTLVLSLLLFSAVLAPIIAWRYSYTLLFGLGAIAGSLFLLITAAGLWLYGRRARRPAGAATRRQAFRVGLACGLLWALEIGINNFLAPALPARDVIDNSFWALIAVSILGAAGVAAYQAGRMRRGLESGLWSGLVSGGVACAMALSVIVFGMTFLLHDPLNVAEWAARGPATGAPSMAAYFAFETLAGAMLHLTVLGIGMGTLLGLVGGLAGKGLRFIKSYGRRA